MPKLTKKKFRNHILRVMFKIPLKVTRNCQNLIKRSDVDVALKMPLTCDGVSFQIKHITFYQTRNSKKQPNIEREPAMLKLQHKISFHLGFLMLKIMSVFCSFFLRKHHPFTFLFNPMHEKFQTKLYVTLKCLWLEPQVF